MKKGKIVYLKPTWLAGVHAYGPYGQSVPDAWQTILDWLDGGSHYEMPERGFGLTYDDPRSVSADELHYVAGVPVRPDWRPGEQSPVVRIEFKGGSYTVLRQAGPYAEVGAFISNCRNNWVPRLGVRLDASRPLLTIYHGDVRKVAASDQVADICLPVTTEPSE